MKKLFTFLVGVAVGAMTHAVITTPVPQEESKKPEESSDKENEESESIMDTLSNFLERFGDLICQLGLAGSLGDLKFKFGKTNEDANPFETTFNTPENLIMIFEEEYRKSLENENFSEQEIADRIEGFKKSDLESQLAQITAFYKLKAQKEADEALAKENNANITQETQNANS